MESLDVFKSLELYQLAYNQYCELEDKIDQKTTEINWLKVRFSVHRFLKLLLWVLAAMLSGILSLFLTCDSVSNFINSLVGHFKKKRDLTKREYINSKKSI